MKAKKIDGVNPFEYTWGISAKDLAEAEGVDITAIFMRVTKYGTPFQRRAKPTHFEARYGKTLIEVAEEVNIHPQRIRNLEAQYGKYFYGYINLLRDATPVDWENLPGYRRGKKFWLMEQHPDYARARKGGWNDE